MSAAISPSAKLTMAADFQLCCPALYQPQVSKPTLEPLRALHLTPMQPQWHHTTPNTLSRLRRIEHIELVRSAAHPACAKSQEYTVKIYYEQPQSHIPTAMWSQCPRTTRCRVSKTGRAPDLQVAHTASQFCSLRNIVHSYVEGAYRASCCSGCQRLGRFMRSGGGRPMAFGTMTMDASGDASALLTVFLNYLLDECQGSECHGQHQIASVLHEFLFRS